MNSHPQNFFNLHFFLTFSASFLTKFVLKACVRYFFCQIFIFNQMIALQKLWKMFLISSKNSFCSRDIQIFVFPSSHLFVPVSHSLGGWPKLNLKVYDVINCLNKNLITHFAQHLGKEKRYDIKTLSIDRVLNKEHLYGKIMQKMCTKN